jgi:ubiquinone/menaquinone biosynthesis C-methylase UbiE/DNA-binding transcriptional ArsR family regulator
LAGAVKNVKLQSQSCRSNAVSLRLSVHSQCDKLKTGRLTMIDQLLTGLRAAGEETRLRLLFILSRGEFNVSELTTVLGQSQPRVSRHLKLMVEAGLVQRYREGAWMLFRLNNNAGNAELARSLIAFMDKTDPQLARDLERINQIKAQRQSDAQVYFAENAENWTAIRAYHVAEEKAEESIKTLVGDRRIGTYVDLGTGTGRMLELFAPLADEAIGIDMSREMLSFARANLGQAGLDGVQVRQGDIANLTLPDGCADLVTLHQVLHFLADPAKAVLEAVRLLKPGGRLVVADFAPHNLEFMREQFAHRRLGIAHYDMTAWAKDAGAKVVRHEQLSPPAHLAQEGLSVVFWIIEKA